MKLFAKQSNNNDEKTSAETFLLQGEWPAESAPVNLNLLARWNLDPENLDASLMSKIFGAAQHNQVGALAKGLQAKIPANLVDPEGFTLLTAAAYKGAQDVVNLLLKMQLNPAYCPPEGKYNALQAACAGGHYELAVKLLEQFPTKLNKGMVDAHKNSLLQIAIQHNQFDFARQWMQYQSPDLTHQDRHGRSMLATALGCYFRANYNIDIEEHNREEELEKFCLDLLKMENAFVPVKEGAVPAIHVLVHTFSALDLPPQTETPATYSSRDAVSALALVSKSIADVLYSQAKPIRGAPFTSEYIGQYESFDFEKRLKERQAKQGNKFKTDPLK